MSKQAILDFYRIAPTPQLTNQTVGFLANNMASTAAAAIRQELRALGYADQAITISDPALLDVLRDEANNLDGSITDTINSFIEEAVQKLAEDASIEDARPAIRQVFDDATAYNAKTLNPYIRSFAAHAGRQAFYENTISPNGKPLGENVPWIWTQNTDFKDDCTEAAAASPDTRDNLIAQTDENVPPPVHRNCQCDLRPDYDQITSDMLPDTPYLGAQTASLRTIRKDMGSYVVAFDWDNTAADFSGQLVPFARAVVAIGGKVGIITGNTAPDLVSQWLALGYPEPNFVVQHGDLHDPRDPEKTNERYAAFKDATCRANNVDLLVDDLRRGEGAPLLRKASGRYLVLQVLVPPGIPEHVEAPSITKADTVERAVEKYLVPTPLGPKVLSILDHTLDPDPYDPDFAGQRLTTTYFDTADGALAQARAEGVDYATCRLREYPDGACFLEAKAPSIKVREQISPTLAADLTSGHADPYDAFKLLPDAYGLVRQAAHGQPLAPSAVTTCTRFARERGSQRITLDVGLRVGDTTFPDALLEIKDARGINKSLVRKFNPDEPRDEKGKWTDGVMSANADKAEAAHASFIAARDALMASSGSRSVDSRILDFHATAHDYAQALREPNTAAADAVQRNHDEYMAFLAEHPSVNSTQTEAVGQAMMTVTDAAVAGARMSPAYGNAATISDPAQPQPISALPRGRSIDDNRDLAIPGGRTGAAPRDFRDAQSYTAHQFATIGATTVGADPATIPHEESAVFSKDAPDQHGGDLADQLHGIQDGTIAAHGDLSPQRVGEIIGSWNLNPTNTLGTLTEAEVAKQFSIPLDAHTQGRIATAEANDQMRSVTSDNVSADIPTYVKAQYAVTQDWYDKHPEATIRGEDGQRYVPLTRVVNFSEGNVPEGWDRVSRGREARMYNDPLSSWTNSSFDAGIFVDHTADHSFEVNAYVPVERIFSNGVTGMGVPNEGEHLVIDGGMNVSVRPAVR